MKLRKVKPSMIRVPELRVTARFTEEQREILRQSVKEAGILSPIIVQEIDGEIVLVDGLHRLVDMIALGDLPVDCAVLDGDMADLLCRNVILDHARGKTPASEMVKVLASLFNDYGLDPEDIRKRTGLTRDYIEKLINVSKAIPQVLEALDDELIGVGKAYQIGRLPHPAQQEKVLAVAVQYGKRLPESELKTQVDAILREMALLPPPDEQPPQERAPLIYQCEGCKSEVEPRYLRPAMLCPNCFGEVWQLAKAAAASKAGNEVETEGA